jgi:hypothetical protein
MHSWVLIQGRIVSSKTASLILPKTALGLESAVIGRVCLGRSLHIVVGNRIAVSGLGRGGAETPLPS